MTRAALLLAAALCMSSGSLAQRWTFEPAVDRFCAAAEVDLRALNEPVAGASGFVRVDAQGRFVRGDGQPIRFWAVNSEVGRRPFGATPLGPKTAPALARHARFLAKRGVNLVRLHRQIGPGPRGLESVDTAERDAIWRAVAAYKREGIYVALSPYWAAAARDGSAPAWGRLFFDADWQRAYRAWLRALLLPPNPYTGVPLAREPALALLQLQNEDSLLFWTVDAIEGAPRRRLEARYVEFLARAGRDADSAPLLPIWELTRTGTDKTRRRADQTEFLARTMREFNAATVRWLRDEIGLRTLVNAGNWKTASAPHLGDAERWTYLPGEVDAVNVYTGGVHRGAHAGWAIVNGDVFSNLSVLDAPQALPLAIKQSVGPAGLRPMLVSEGHWTPPNAYAAEAPWLVAVLGASAGLGGYAWFTTEDAGFSAPRSANGHLPSLAKWDFATPEVLGSFPAAALVFRRALLPRVEPGAVLRRSSTALWQRVVPPVVEPSGFDPNRDVGAPSPGGQSALQPRPTWTVFDAAPLPSVAAAGEPAWRFDAADRVIRLDAPAAQGVVGFLDRRDVHRTSALEVRSANGYGALLAVALDNAPLATSQRVLIQFATRSRPTGWRESALDGGLMRIDDIGRAPWQVESARLTLRLHNAALRRARVLDMNLEPRAEVALARDGAALSLRFPDDAMYVLLD